MEPEVSTRNTKNEIMEAYNALLKKVKEQKPVDRQADKEKVEKKEIVETAAKSSVETIVKGLADLKLAITRSLDDMERQLLGESKKLHNLRQAIDIEQKNLEEIHEIRAEADSLATLLLAQAEKKQAFAEEIEQKRHEFETEMGARKLQWKKEQEDYERLQKERGEESKRSRQREEEEYTYNLNLTRKKDRDAYAEKKATLEKELEDKGNALEKEWSAREGALAAQERELTDLRARVESFPQDLEKAVNSTEQAVTERLEFKYQHEAQMLAKETEGERKLSQQVITSLEAKIKEQEEQIRQLAQKANEAGLQVQSIALKAIEGAAPWRVGATQDRSGESSNR